MFIILPVILSAAKDRNKRHIVINTPSEMALFFYLDRAADNTV
jgi:hypothetical protein